MAARAGSPAPSAARRVLACYRRHRADVLLAVVVLLLVAPVVQPLMDQQQARYLLTAAIVDDGTIRLDAYRDHLGVDRAERAGHTYSDKAPAQPVLGVPAYAVYRLSGGVPAAEDRPLGNLGLWAVSLLVVALPTAVCAVLMRHLVRIAGLDHGALVALATVVATMLLPFGTQLFSHALTACLLLGAWLLVWRGGRGALVAAGLLCGLAVAAEYSSAPVVGVLTIAAALRHRGGVGWVALGGLGPGLALAAYHWAAFGAPWAVGYQFSVLGAGGAGVVGVGWPSARMLVQVLAGERGLFVLTPLVALGVVGCVLALRERAAPWRGHAVVALACLAVLVTLQSGWGNPTGGWSPGPRYVVPALPLLAVGVAWMAGRWPALVVAATVVGAATMGLATATLPLAPTDSVALAWWAQRLVDARVADTLLTLRLGDWALLVPPAAAVLLATRLRR